VAEQQEHRWRKALDSIDPQRREGVHIGIEWLAIAIISDIPKQAIVQAGEWLSLQPPADCCAYAVEIQQGEVHLSSPSV
jgi:hypothetical protein